MKTTHLLAIPLALAICVSTGFAQESNADNDQDFAKAASLLHGDWTGDAEKTAEAIKDMEDMELDESMMEMILEQVKAIKIQFADGTFEVAIAGQEMAGEWEVTGAKEKDGKQAVMIHVSPNEESQGEEKNFKIHMLGDTHMKMIDMDEGGPPIVLKRESE